MFEIFYAYYIIISTKMHNYPHIILYIQCKITLRENNKTTFGYKNDIGVCRFYFKTMLLKLRSVIILLTVRLDFTKPVIPSKHQFRK